MAAPTLQMTTQPLSQKQRKAACRKERRKRKRQALAKARDCGLNNGHIDTQEDGDLSGQDDDAYELERLRLHEEWLERERLAQEEFQLKCEREEAAQKRKEEEERMIKEEWEAQQKKEQEEKEQKQKEKRDRENQPSNSVTMDTNRKKNAPALKTKNEAVQKMLDEAENQLENKGPWMNPEAPAVENPENYGTECDVANCPFFLKTGACRFGDRCSRKHNYPTTSPTLMIRGMFITFGMDESRRDDYDIDAWLEHSEEDLLESFVEFYHDVLPELRSVGKVVQFKVCCNYEPHLRGNVYVQFDREEQCKEALMKFHGRWYAGRQLHCELSPVTRWKNAICGLFDRQKCPKGKHCNFLHVFRNPTNEFWEADRDLHLSPDRSVRGSRRDERSWRQRRRSRSPMRSERSFSWREAEWRRSARAGRSERRSGWCRSRSRSRSRRDRASRSRSRSRSRRDRASRSRSRSRSRRDRASDRLRSRSRDKKRCRSQERGSQDNNTDTAKKVREKSRSSSREGRRSTKSGEKSPKKPPRDGETSNGNKSHRRHKKSKKKKSKKKHKKKSRRSEGMSSSGESDSEEDTKDTTAEGLGTSSPAGEMPESQPVKEETELESLPREEDGDESMHPEVKIERSDSELERSINGDGIMAAS